MSLKDDKEKQADEIVIRLFCVCYFGKMMLQNQWERGKER